MKPLILTFFAVILCYSLLSGDKVDATTHTAVTAETDYVTPRNKHESLYSDSASVSYTTAGIERAGRLYYVSR